MKKSLIASIVFLVSTNTFAQSSAADLKTNTGNEIGITVSAYSYSEPGINVSMKATNLGIDYTGTYAFGNDWFVLGNFNYNNGPIKYSGSGTQSGIPQFYIDLKGVVGYDFAFERFNLSPYIGLAYRYLYQQWGSSITSTGAQGYDRQSTYNYLPLGFIHRMDLATKSKLETTLELKYLISGNQISSISPTDIKNSQNSGYGLSLTVIYKEDNWSIGPYFKYWNIQQSDMARLTVIRNNKAISYNVYEPANNTKEYGIKASYRF